MLWSLLSRSWVPLACLALAPLGQKVQDKGRSDDCATLREDAISYIRPVKDVAGVEDVPEVDRKAKKDARGFRHHSSDSTARLLCPRHLRDKFDEDREKFCRDVENGKRVIIHDDWPAFLLLTIMTLYPEDASGYNPDAIDKGLLRGPFLVSVSIPIDCMFTANLFVVLTFSQGHTRP